jgi:shikimate dehydrogenase
LNWRYLTIEVPPEKLRDAITGMRAFGMQGINLTIPHKVAVIGENTDGRGFLRGVRSDAGVDPNGRRVIVLGAGGAARAIVTELALVRAPDLLVLNRSSGRGEAMVAEVASKTKTRIRFQAWEGIYAVSEDADIPVNATSIDQYPDVDSMPALDLRAVRPGMLVCDVVFNPPETGSSGQRERGDAGARRSGNARLPGRDWVRVVDWAKSTGMSYEECAPKGAGTRLVR